MNSTFEICTAQFRYKGDDRLDITAGTVHALERRGKAWNEAGEGRLYAPPGWLPAYHKRGRVDDSEYRTYYDQIMRLRYTHLAQEYKAHIVERVTRGDSRIVLVCYCAAGKFCHRLIAQDYLYKIACSIDELRDRVVFTLGDELFIPPRFQPDDTPEMETLPLW